MARKGESAAKGARGDRDEERRGKEPKARKSASARKEPAKGRKANRSVPDTLGVTAAANAVASGSAKAKKALKAAKDNTVRLVPEAPSISLPPNVGEMVKTIGGQIVSALNTDVGRVLVAELLIYIAKSLTKAAANTEVAEDAKDAILNAGAKIGAAAADAGAKFLETGAAAADAGGRLVSDGVSAAGEATGSVKDVVREVAQVAVGAVGGAAAEAVSRAIKGRGQGGSKPPATGPVASRAGGPMSPANVDEQGYGPGRQL